MTKKSIVHLIFCTRLDNLCSDYINKINIINKNRFLTHQSLQDPLALVVGAVIRQDAPVDQNQPVQEQPGAEPEQSEHQGSPTGPQPEAQPPEQAQTPAETPSSRHQSSREHAEKTCPKSSK